jgi:ABC-type uncharacterized transport system YnjBCD substrate-binding protein
MEAGIMSKFTVRIELHDAESDDYESLHEAMEDQGFSRTITGDNGVNYHLPWAEYTREGKLTIDQVLDDAQSAADTTGMANSVLVTESAGRRWSGLEPVED